MTQESTISINLTYEQVIALQGFAKTEMDLAITNIVTLFVRDHDNDRELYPSAMTSLAEQLAENKIFYDQITDIITSNEWGK